MASRRQLLVSCAMAGVLFIVLQLFLHYQHTLPHPIQHVRLKSSAYNLVKNFVTLCDSKGVKVVLVDPYILRELVDSTYKNSNSPCKYLCKNHVYTFAVETSQFDHFNSKVLPTMKQEAFDIDAVYKSGALAQPGEIPTHIHLRDHEHHAIHVVVLHERKDHLWFGADPETELTMLDFTQYEGALARFEYDFKVPLDGVEVYIPQQPQAFLDDYSSSHFIPCNQTRADLFYSQHGGRDETKNATEFRKRAVDALTLMTRRLNDFGVTFWLSSGTLLGWYRQCDIIPYSHDVDLGIFIKDLPDNLVLNLKTTGIHLEHKFGLVTDSLQYAFLMDNIKLDIFFFYEDDDGKVWNGGTDYNSGRKFKYTFDKFSLCWTEFYGMRVRVPCPTEPYIQANYGPNWFEPVKHWLWNESPPNVVEVPSWRDDQLDDVIELYDEKGRKIPLEWVNDEL